MRKSGVYGEVDEIALERKGDYLVFVCDGVLGARRASQFGGVSRPKYSAVSGGKSDGHQMGGDAVARKEREGFHKTVQYVESGCCQFKKTIGGIQT